MKSSGVLANVQYTCRKHRLLSVDTSRQIFIENMAPKRPASGALDTLPCWGGGTPSVFLSVDFRFIGDVFFFFFPAEGTSPFPATIRLTENALPFPPPPLPRE